MDMMVNDPNRDSMDGMITNNVNSFSCIADNEEISFQLITSVLFAPSMKP